MNKAPVRLLHWACLMLTLACAGAALAHGDEQHGNHNPDHGGAVLMHMDLHYEVVLRPQGGVQIYYTDAMRNELPASVVSDVAVEIERPGSKIEPVEMAIGATGEYWEGVSEPVSDPRSVVRVAFVYQGEPVLVNLPGSYWPNLGKAGDAAGSRRSQP